MLSWWKVKQTFLCSKSSKPPKTQKSVKDLAQILCKARYAALFGGVSLAASLVLTLLFYTF